MMATESHTHAAPLLAERPALSAAQKVATSRAAPAAGRSGFVPLLLLVLAVVVWLGVQCALLALEARQFDSVRDALSAQVQTATQLRASLDGVATATARLATAGNPTAAALVAELHKRGVTINQQTVDAPK